MESSDTIAAIATGMTNSGIGIVRISGSEALAVADRVYCSKNRDKKLRDMKSHTAHYGFLYDGDELIDEVMVLIMRAPNSYTAEDTVEIDCHGGTVVMERILRAVVKHGARPAEPGEFTKRAFLSGRIDLSRAEAVMDVIQSKNEYALKNSMRQLKGDLYREIKSLRDQILYEIAFIESALDDPEHISLEGYPEKLRGILGEVGQRLDRLLCSSKKGKIVREGIDTVIIGKPNAGKSTLLNVMAGEDRAIVTDIAGTTRDAIKETVTVGGIGLNIIDTAGIRETQDAIEKIGVERARRFASEADLVLYMADASVKLDESDEEILELVKDKRMIVLLNKTDLKVEVGEEDIRKKLWKKGIRDCRVLPISAKENRGLEDFEKVIREMFLRGEIDYNDQIIITNVRHAAAIEEAGVDIQNVMRSIDGGLPEDFYSIDLMGAYSCLGKIIGEEVGEDLVNEIFGKFCTGK